MSFTVNLPPPPSVNHAFANLRKGGRLKTKPYSKWRDAAAWLIKAEVPAASRVAGPFAVWINLPCSLPGDIDNRIKGVIDALVSSGRVDDDKHMTEIHVCRANAGDLAAITVKEGLKVEA